MKCVEGALNKELSMYGVSVGEMQLEIINLLGIIGKVSSVSMSLGAGSLDVRIII
jgi:hypothetical protein